MIFIIPIFLILFFASNVAIEKYAQKHTDKYSIGLFGAIIGSGFCFVIDFIFKALN